MQEMVDECKYISQFCGFFNKPFEIILVSNQIFNSLQMCLCRIKQLELELIKSKGNSDSLLRHGIFLCLSIFLMDCLCKTIILSLPLMAS